MTGAAARPRAAPDLNLHASALVMGEAGLLVRGASGAGKTRLALALVARAREGGGFARLVADDRTLVWRHGTALVARPHPALAGRVERRGLGIVAVEHEVACRLAFAVDLVDGWPDRWPEAAARRCDVAGVALPRLAVARQAPTVDAVALVLDSLSAAFAPP